MIEYRGIFLHAADALVCCLILFPSKVCYWRGIWDLYGVYVFPGNEPLNHWTTFGIGSCCIVGYLTLPIFDEYIGTCSRLVRVIATRLLLFIYALANMAYWRAVWCLPDYYMGFDLTSNLITMFICIGLLLLLRGIRMAFFSPLSMIVDTKEHALLPSTRLDSKPSFTLLYVVDCFLSHFVLTTLSIVLWRSAWNVYDLFWFYGVDSELFSNVSSLLLGLCGCLLIIGLEVPLKKASVFLHEQNWYLRLFFEMFISIVGFGVLLFYWRGGWILNETYLIADRMLGGWVNFAVGSVALMALQVFSYVGSCGCAVDGAQEPQSGIFETKYIRRCMYQAKQKLEITKDAATKTKSSSDLSNGLYTVYKTCNEGVLDRRQ